MVALIASMFAILPVNDSAVRQRFDVIERNEYHDPSCKGELTFAQHTFSDWTDKHLRDDVQAWRMVKPSHEAYYDHERRVWRMTFFDDGYLRVIEAPSYIETQSNFDRELFAREDLPKERRRDLLKPKTKQPSRANDGAFTTFPEKEDVSQ